MTKVGLITGGIYLIATGQTKCVIEPIQGAREQHLTVVLIESHRGIHGL